MSKLQDVQITYVNEIMRNTILKFKLIKYHGHCDIPSLQHAKLLIISKLPSVCGK